MPRLLLLRHAQSVWNAEGRWQGWANPPLSAFGEEQAEAAGRLLAKQLDGPFDAAVSSDLDRARRTAELVLDGVGTPLPVATNPDLREYGVGEWSGLTRDEIEARWPGLIEAWSLRQAVPPGGEDRHQFDRRVLAAVERIAAGAERPDSRILVVAHGGLIRSLFHSLHAPDRHVTHLSGAWLATTDRGLFPVKDVRLFDTEYEGSPAV